jgi:ABC-type transporter Mla subunit MlaD
MTLNDKLAALADTLAAEGAKRTVQALRDAILTLDALEAERDDALDALDATTQNLKEVEDELRAAQHETKAYRNLLVEMVARIPHDILNDGGRLAMREQDRQRHAMADLYRYSPVLTDPQDFLKGLSVS